MIGVPAERGGCSCQDVRTWSVSNRHKHREGAATKYFAGLDVSLEETAICIVDEKGGIMREVRAASETDALIEALQGTGFALERVGLEACSLSAWLHDGLTQAGLPAICIETRQANAAMKTMPNDSNQRRLLRQQIDNKEPQADGQHASRSLFRPRQSDECRYE